MPSIICQDDTTLVALPKKSSRKANRIRAAKNKALSTRGGCPQKLLNERRCKSALQNQNEGRCADQVQCTSEVIPDERMVRQPVARSICPSPPPTENTRPQEKALGDEAKAKQVKAQELFSRYLWARLDAVRNTVTHSIASICTCPRLTQID
jgi:hypothetical protein